MALFAYEFMRRAFVVGILLGGIIPCIGVIVVLRRLSMIGDALSHASLAGVAAGLLGGVNPLVGAAGACIAGALGIEAVRRKLPRYAELSIAVILSAGVGLAGLLSGMLDSATGFNSFLFGSIVAIDDFELAMVVIVSVVAAGVFLLLYRQLLSIAFDERGARLAGVHVQRINLVFTLLTALAVAIAARTVGALMVSSLMVVPVVCSMQLAGSYRGLVILSAVQGVAFSIAGLTTAYYMGLRPGSTIVLCGIAWLLALVAFKRLRALLRHAKGRRTA